MKSTSHVDLNLHSRIYYCKCDYQFSNYPTYFLIGLHPFKKVIDVYDGYLQNMNKISIIIKFYLKSEMHMHMTMNRDRNCQIKENPHIDCDSEFIY